MLCNMAVHLFTFFGKNCLCESIFLMLRVLKRRLYRSVLTEEHTQQFLAVVATKDKPDIAAIAANQNNFHMSH